MLAVTKIPLQKRDEYSSCGLFAISFAADTQGADSPANSTFDLSKI